jgi:hypothetical protein
MTYPPDGCDYLIAYLNAGHETDGERFTNEYALGDWVMRMEAAGQLDRECDGLLYRIYAVTPHQRVPISLDHPRLVQGRLRTGPHAPAWR